MRIAVNGVELNYQDEGAGEPVVLVMGTGGAGSVWHLHQVPALVSAGFRVVTYDQRGLAPGDGDDFGIDDLVADLAGLIEALDLAPCRLVGTSMGSYVIQELATARPELVRQMLLLATRGRVDHARRALAQAQIELEETGATVPTGYLAATQAMLQLSPVTLADDRLAADWLELFQYGRRSGPGVRAQMRIALLPDRLEQYKVIGAPCHVIAFEHDLVTPPHLGREVAEAIPDATFEVIPACGHFGYLESPATVNARMLDVLQRDRVGGWSA